MTHYDLVEGDIVTLPDGTKVEVEQLGHDRDSIFFICTEEGEQVWYDTDILDSHPANEVLLD